MDLPARKTLSHIPPDWVRADEAMFFITIGCQVRGPNQLCQPDTAVRLRESIFFRQARGDWWVDLILLMPDHLHTLVAFPSGANMAQVVGQWKEYTAKTIGVQWQRNFFDHRVRRDESLVAKADYILNNPVRRGFVARAED